MSWVKNSEVFVCSNVMGVHPFKAHPKQKVSSKFGIIPIFTFTNPQHLLRGDTNPCEMTPSFCTFCKAQKKLVTKRDAQKTHLAGLWCFRIVSKNHGPKGVALPLVECLVGMQCLSPQGTGGKHTEHRAIPGALFQIERAGQKLNRIWMVLIERHHQDFSIASLDDREE